MRYKKSEISVGHIVEAATRVLARQGYARTSLAPEFVQRALRLVDWHHGRTPAFGTRSERGRAAFLSSEECLRPLVAWYGH